MSINPRALVKAKELIGVIYVTNEGYEVVVVDYEDRHHVKVAFVENPKHVFNTTTQNLTKGQIKNPYHRAVYGVGYYGVGKYVARDDKGNKLLAYKKWFSMFNRCYSEKYQIKQPSYNGCVVGDDFQCYQDFARWFYDNYYEFDEKLELDKDLMVEGNKQYSSINCCFLPKIINNALRHRRHDAEYMQKVCKPYWGRLPQRIEDKLRQLTRVGGDTRLNEAKMEEIADRKSM